MLERCNDAKQKCRISGSYIPKLTKSRFYSRSEQINIIFSPQAVRKVYILMSFSFIYYFLLGGRDFPLREARDGAPGLEALRHKGMNFNLRG